MKFALLNDKRIEATKRAKGICPSCGSELVARCGEIKIHHWAHKKKCDDHWWENETEWHRNWKNRFPKEWQEIIQHDSSGEKHIADIKTKEGWVIEFQHSRIEPEERRSRDSFYSKLIWVIDGTRLKTDIKQFKKIIDEGHLDVPSLLLLLVSFPNWSRLLMDWKDSNSLIFIDFGMEYVNNQDLWLIYPKKIDGNILLSKFSRSAFIQYLNDSEFGGIIDLIINPIQKTTQEYSKEQKKRNNELLSEGLSTQFYSNYFLFPQNILEKTTLPNNILKKIEPPYL